MAQFIRSATISVTSHSMAVLALLVFVFADLISTVTSDSNVTSTVKPEDEEVCTKESTPCKKGLIIPLWLPQGNLSPGDKAARATVYFAAMIYMFLGVSIIADRFMAAIEVITSKEREIVVKKPSGDTTVVTVRIWNETVSNLTLMALGSSAPEILLSVIEVCGNKFEAGDLGPSTIVGSAAFNLFIIIALCVSCLPGEEIRRVKHLRVFLLTATWSIFAYLWLYFILAVSSYGVVTVLESILTLLFFPLTVITAYIADKKIFVYKFLSKKYRTSKQRGVIVSHEGDTELGKVNNVGDEILFEGLRSDDPDVREFELHRKEYMDILRELRKKHPNADMKSLEEMAELEAINRGPKSRAFYRIQATRKLTGGGNVIKKSKIERRASLEDIKVSLGDSDVTHVFFDPGHYTVMENVGQFSLTVTREGGDLNKTLYVDYKTEDGTANAGSDFEFAEGTLVFYPLETHKQFQITIIDDEIFEEDEHFYVRLSNLRIGDSEGMFESNNSMAKLGTPFLATVMILDDDHPGIFHFEEHEMRVSEAAGEINVNVVRSSGARGTVKVPYHSIDGTAKVDKDFELSQGELIFTNDETEKSIKVHIFDDEEYEKNEVFYIALGEPYLIRKGSGKAKSFDRDSGAALNDVSEENDPLAELAKPRLGDNTKVAIHIKESQEFKSVVDKLLKKANVSLVVGTSSWREQFTDAITVSPGDEDEEESEEKLPSCTDYVMHFLTLFWKILFAFVPPTGKFTNVVAKWPGSCHDSHIFRNSSIGLLLEENHRGFDVDGVLLGDSGYACKPYLMTPYLRPASRAQERFNSAHRRTRVIIEQSFGWLKRKFHCLHGELRLSPDRACNVILACTVLHNIAMDLGEPVEDPEPSIDDDALAQLQPVVENGRTVRDRITRMYFSN